MSNPYEVEFPARLVPVFDECNSAEIEMVLDLNVRTPELLHGTLVGLFGHDTRRYLSNHDIDIEKLITIADKACRFSYRKEERKVLRKSTVRGRKGGGIYECQDRLAPHQLLAAGFSSSALGTISTLAGIPESDGGRSANAPFSPMGSAKGGRTANLGTESMDLIPVAGAPPVRDQGKDRATCVAFAETARLEFSAYPFSADALSEQFLYWAIKNPKHKIDSSPKRDGTRVEYAVKAIKKFGVCKAELWPYDPRAKRQPSHRAWWIPSSRACKDASSRTIDSTYLRWKEGEEAPGPGSEILHKALSELGRPICVHLAAPADPLSGRDVFNSPSAELYGVISDFAMHASRISSMGHCVCVLGYRPDPMNRTGGFFIFRNSYGARFARKAPDSSQSLVPAPGYGQMSARFVDCFVREMSYTPGNNS